MRIVSIADTHELHRELEVPDGHVLIPRAILPFFRSSHRSITSSTNGSGNCRTDTRWSCPATTSSSSKEPRHRTIIKNATLLTDSGVEVAGLRIWGSPVTPLYGGAFGMPNSADRRRHWAQVPDGIDILVTHGPPLGILDHAPGSQRKEGDPELLEAVLRVEPRLHVFGHIHYGYGTQQIENTLFVNAAVFTAGDLRRPIVAELGKL
jgi:hypothetical protein